MGIDYLIFGNVDSRDYGILVFFKDIDRTPKRVYERISIPGRNKEFLLDEKRFEDVPLSYDCVALIDDDRKAFVNALAAQIGYQRMEDSFNPGEFYSAVFEGDVDPRMLPDRDQSTFTINFTRGAERYLASGECEVALGGWGNTETATGAIVQINNDSALGVKALSVGIEPAQSGSGTPSPTNVRPISGYNSVKLYVSHTSTEVDGNTYTITLNGTQYGGSLDVLTGALTVNRAFITLDGSSDETYTDASSSTVHSIVYTPTDTPKSYVTAAIPPYDISNYLQPRSRSNITGNLQGFTHYSGGLRINITGLTSVDEYRAYFANNPLQIVYELATPQTVQLTAQQVGLLTGANYIWANSGDVAVEYGIRPDALINPTLFEARPMLEVEGYGNIQFNGYNIDLENAAMGDIVLADPKTETSRSYFSITFKNGQFNAGDVITLNGALFKWYQDTSGAILSSVSSITHSNNKFSTSYSGTASSTSPATTTVQSLTFAAGTDSTVTDTMTLVGTRSGSTVRLYVTTEITYTYEWTTGMSRIYFSTWKSSSTTDPVNYHVNSVSHLGARGTSTVSILGHPTYMDCDLGEVYMIKDGSAISLNAYVDLGSDLPCLGVGANEFLYDNTVTDLKVIPRWWKV